VSTEVAASMVYARTTSALQQVGIAALRSQRTQDQQVVDLVAQGLEQTRQSAPPPASGKGQVLDIMV